MSSTLRRSAHAKVNLGLEIIRRREDGFHDIETVFHEIALADDVVCEQRPRAISMECSDPSLPVDNRNLCLRAAEALRTMAGVSTGAHIILTKRIPHGSGLGGGSSDAAATLMMLRDLWSVRISDEQLAELAVTIGADVPFFFTGGTSFGSGKGDVLERLTTSFPYWILTVVPPIRISTAWAYRQISVLSRPGRSSLRDRFLESLGDLDALRSVLVNDFEGPVIAAHPEIGDVRRRLLDAGLRPALLSGSGSAVFGLSADESTARRASELFEPRYFTSLTPPRP